MMTTAIIRTDKWPLQTTPQQQKWVRLTLVETGLIVVRYRS